MRMRGGYGVGNSGVLCLLWIPACAGMTVHRKTFLNRFAVGRFVT